MDFESNFQTGKEPEEMSPFAEALGKRFAWIVFLGLAWGISLTFVALGIAAVKWAW